MIQVNPDKELSTSDIIVAGGGSLDSTLSTINTNISNLTTEVGKKITGSGIANNLTTTSEGYALDARQGKALSDTIADKIKTDVPANAVFTDTTTGTTYNAGSAPNNTTFGTNGSIKNVYDKFNTINTISPTLNTTNVSSGQIYCRTAGRICQVYLSNIVFKNSGDNLTIVSGLPKAAIQVQSVFAGWNAASTGAILTSGTCAWISTGGTSMQAHVGSGDQNREHWISLTYIIGN